MFSFYAFPYGLLDSRNLLLYPPRLPTLSWTTPPGAFALPLRFLGIEYSAHGTFVIVVSSSGFLSFQPSRLRSGGDSYIWLTSSVTLPSCRRSLTISTQGIVQDLESLVRKSNWTHPFLPLLRRPFLWNHILCSPSTPVFKQFTALRGPRVIPSGTRPPV